MYKLSIYSILTFVALIGSPSIASAVHVEAGPAYAAIGEFSYDARMAYRMNRADIIRSGQREVCSVESLDVVGQAYAEMFKLRHHETCSDQLVVLERPEEPEGVCKSNMMEGLGTGYLEEGESDEAVLVSLDLTSYRMNPRAERAVRQNLRAFSGRIKKRFSIYLSRSSRYVRMMQSILREEGVPEDIVYLALIESGFNPRAYSRSRAAGPWQFMKPTAKRYRLKVNKWVDERRDPVKSTRAAARYLKYLHNLFDSWSLAMASYNAGEGRVGRALKSTGSKDFWSLMGTRKIKPETKNYVPKFIAARLIAVYPERYGFTDIDYQEDFVFDEVVLKKQMSLKMAAKCAGTTVKVIKELNPELRRDKTPPLGSYTLRVPRGTRGLFVSNALREAGKGSVAARLYRVESGESLGSISEKTGVPGETILSYNRLDDVSLGLEAGQTIIIPTLH